MPIRYHLAQIVSLMGLLLAAFVTNLAGGSSIGACYGMLGDNLPTPIEVISMYKFHQISRVRLYDPNPSALEALSGSNIQVLVGVRNEDRTTLLILQCSANLGSK